MQGPELGLQAALAGGGPWVVKLGGSLAESPLLPLWLEALAATGAVIVPGGGPFADAVRQAQARWHFGETAAHHMAILGMRQYGLMLAGLCPRLLKATTVEDLAATPHLARIWLPLPEQLDAAGIPATWDLTSDSLSAWLAGRVHASNLLLVKSVSPASASFPPMEADVPTGRMRENAMEAMAGEISCGQLVKQNWVDPAFPEYAGGGPFQSWFCGPDAYLGLGPALAAPSGHFIHIGFGCRGSLK